MKEMSKARVLAKKSVNSVMNERKLLEALKHPFIVNMQYSFQDRDNLYLVMDLLAGGDLRYHLGRQKVFTEEQTRFFAACIITGLEALHNNGVIHRDIKPENLVLDENGYLRITDFGIARVWNPENAKDTSGTPGYMAPEVMCRQNHGVAVDYFALGVICYEFMTGRRPYQGKSRKEIRDLVLAKQVQLVRTEIPENWSYESADFINKLIQRKPLNRLGLNGPQEVKQHPWISAFPWAKLLEKTLAAPFLPSRSEENFDARLHLNNDPWKDANSEAMQQSAELLRKSEIQSMFAGYFYDIEQKQSGVSSLSTV
jgi:serine/threonine protein kinase